jgi:hypothetical protein
VSALFAQEEPQPGGLDLEWQRVELLTRCLCRSRHGEEIDVSLLDRLAEAQRALEAVRRTDAVWGDLARGLSELELDVLACVLAPEARPSIAWTFESLQATRPQPYPTPSLVHDLLALEADGVLDLYAALGPDAPLRRRALVELDGDGPFYAVRPGPGVSAAVLGRPELRAAPPGSVDATAEVGWDDLVLPGATVVVLEEYLAWLRCRETVFGTWGAHRPGGPLALFAGPSGTGKTLAASVLAAELGWPLFRVDIGRLVSKYIGETEKNINRLLDAAHGRPLVLQIDEADSLFGKRGEVRDARDRYANLEVSHLLARIENHDGPCILTTNLKRHLDPAFLRRFQLVVDFPRPGPQERARLWALHLPPRAPRSADVRTDRLGADLNLTGGGIRNAALHASVLAAAGDGVLGLDHLAVAVWRELTKENRDVAAADLGSLATYLPRGIRDDEEER